MTPASDDPRTPAAAGRQQNDEQTRPDAGSGLAEALYERGMTHYQSREWRQALDHFKQLKRLQANWPGLDSLIDEANWFLQLEEVEATNGQLLEMASAEEERRWRWRWLAPALLILIIAAALAFWQGWIPGLALGRNLEREALYNRGQSSLAVGDYEAALAAFGQLIQLAPNDPAVQDGWERAQRLEALALAYRAAEDAIAIEDWKTAEDKLRQVLAIDPGYADAAGRLSFVRNQGQAATLFQAGIAAYDAADYETAIEQLQRVSEVDPDYQRDTVRELLFVLYLNDGQARLATPGASADLIRQAIGRFGKALALRPRNVQAAEESRLANQLLDARLALDRQDWPEAQRILQPLVEQKPDYAGGQANELLYLALLGQADQAREAGNLALAEDRYRRALALAVQDTRKAEAGLRALQSLFTPTPTPTALPTATPLPTPFVEVRSPILNVRLGPGVDFPVVGQVTAGQQLALLGRNESGDWLVICCVDGQPGWVAGNLISTTANVDLLPVGMPPTRVPTPTPTATPTATPVPPEAFPTPTSVPAREEPPQPTATPEPTAEPEPTATPEPR